MPASSPQEVIVGLVENRLVCHALSGFLLAFQGSSPAINTPAINMKHLARDLAIALRIGGLKEH